MNLFKRVTIIATLMLLVVACKNTNEPEVKTVKIETSKKESSSALDPNATYAKVEFNIKGMTCAMGCAKTIEKKMAKMEGVKMAKVDFDKEFAMVEYDEAKVTPNSLKEAVAKVSDIYKVEDLKQVENFSIEKGHAEPHTSKMECKADCKMDCCNDKGNKVTKDKIACAESCEKDCCKVKKA